MATRANGDVLISHASQQWRSGKEAQILARHAADPNRDPAVSPIPKAFIGGPDSFYRRTTTPPSMEKGALWAQAPDMPERGDVLSFSRYPTVLSVSGQANIASEIVPGRALTTMQHLGGRGIRFSLQLFFYDAFIDVGRHACAEAANKWFALYVTGHDGTGAALPYVHTYLQVGRSDPIRVVIHGYDMSLAHFDPNDRPQHADVKVELEVFEPVYLVSPFRPVAPRQTREAQKRPANKGCGEGVAMTPPAGQRVGGDESVQQQVNRGVVGRFMTAWRPTNLARMEQSLRRGIDVSLLDDW